MRVNGTKTICMALENTIGKMAVCMKGSISMIRNMVLGHIHGLMAGGMLVSGLMESNMEKENT